MMLESNPNIPQSEKPTDETTDTNSLTDYTPKFVNGAGLPGGMRWNDLGLDHVPLPPKDENASHPVEAKKATTPQPDSIWKTIRKFLGQ